MTCITSLFDANDGCESRLYNHEHPPSKRVRRELAQLLQPGQSLTLQQFNALGWLLEREDCPPDGVRGGLVLDVPGLGKTTQMLALIAIQSLRLATASASTSSSSSAPPRSLATLVVCPSRVICEVWASELNKRFNPDVLVSCIFHGPGRAALWKQHVAAAEAARGRGGGSLLLLTTYATLAQEAKAAAGSSPLFAGPFHRVVLDEAHLVRNAKTKVAKAIVDLEAAVRWAMTATPIHNHVQDLFNLVKFLRIRPYAQDAKRWHADVVELAHQDRSAALRRLHALLSGVALRRGADQLKLPEIAYVEVVLDQKSEQESRFYAALHEYCALRAREFLARRDTNGTGGRRGVSSCLLTLITYLREACCHPWLAVASMRRFRRELAGVDLSVVTQRLEKLAKRENRTGECNWCLDMEADGVNHPGYECLHRFCRACERADATCKLCAPPAAGAFAAKKKGNKDASQEAREQWDQLCQLEQGNFVASSAKLHHLVQEVQRHWSQEKIIVVSQWVRLLRLVELELGARLPPGAGVIRLGGETPTTQRSRLIDDFQNDPGVRLCLLSLTCSSEGITLTAATRMYIVDPWWNPAKDYQAMHRLYRLGQDKPVQIFALYVQGTVEDRIRCMRAAKGAVAMAAVGEAAPPEELDWIEQARLFFEPPRPKNAKSAAALQPPECFLPGKVKASVKYGADYDKEVDLEREALLAGGSGKRGPRWQQHPAKEAGNGKRKRRWNRPARKNNKPFYYAAESKGSRSVSSMLAGNKVDDDVSALLRDHPMFDLVSL